MNPHNDGLGLSVLIYLAALLVGLGVVALPFYEAMRPIVIKNANAHSFEQHEYRAAFSRYRFLHLKEPAIVTPAELARVNAQEKETERERRAPVRVARRILPPPPQPVHPPPRPRNSFAEIRVHLGLSRIFALF